MFSFKLPNYVIVQTLIAACVNLGEIICGYQVSWSAPMLPKLSDPEETPLSQALPQNLQSWVVSTLYIGGVGAFLAGYLSNRIGRRRTLILSAVLSLLVNVFLALATNVAMLLTARTFQGVSVSMIAVSGLIYVGEIASPNIRGKIYTTMGVFHAIGGLLVMSVGPFVNYKSVAYVVIAINALYVLACWFLPESPMFYVIKDNEKSAESTLRYLGRDKDITNELKIMFEKVKEQREHKHIWRELFTAKINQYSLFIAMFMTMFQQLSGIVSVIVFSTNIFEEAGSSLKPDIATIIIGAALTVGSCISPIFIEKVGRKILLLVSTAGCSLSMVVLGLYLYLKFIESSYLDNLRWMPVASMTVAILMYSVGLAIIPNTLVGELFSSKARSLGNPWCLIWGWICGFACTYAFGYAITALGGHVTFWIFAVINATAFVFILAFVPETKGKSLMEIQIMLENWGRDKSILIL